MAFHRRNNNAAERRAQRTRANARRLGYVLNAVTSLAHRGSAPTRGLRELVATLRDNRPRPAEEPPTPVATSELDDPGKQAEVGTADVATPVEHVPAAYAAEHTPAVEPSLSMPIRANPGADTSEMAATTDASPSRLLAAIAAVQANGLALHQVDAAMKGDITVVMHAVRQNGLALEYAAQEMKNCVHVVREAVMQNGLALEHASEEMRDNGAVVIEAVRQNREAMTFMGDDAWMNRSSFPGWDAMTAEHLIELAEQDEETAYSTSS